MNFEKTVKTGVIFGGITSVAMTGAIYGESFSNEPTVDAPHELSSMSKFEINTFTSTQTFGIGSSIDPFIHLDNSFNADSPGVIVKNALKQIKHLDYIEIDDEIDREIDAFFASRQSKRVKKILYKRS